MARAQQSVRRPAREAYSTRRITFESGGETCVGTLYLPDRPDSPPIVVMAPGLGMWRSALLPAIAERFAESGVAAFSFDFRHHGDSDGKPRGLAAPDKQIADYEAAIEAMTNTEAVDSNRLVLWGYSFSGGHVLSVAAGRFDIAGVIATAPFVDGRRELKRSIQRPGRFVRSTLAGLRDALGSKVGRNHPVRLVDDPDGFGVITVPGAKRAVLDAVARDSAWNNRLPARIFLAISTYRPITSVDEIRCPTLVIGGRDDEVAPAAWVADAADRVPESTFIELPADHMSVFDADFERVVGRQLTFLRSIVGERESVTAATPTDNP
ncbi:MAG: lysophospholipase [Halonotius sp. J07HN4]|nr:MAG: lysophospholipase [Halonotius sp. J07HN4]